MGKRNLSRSGRTVFYGQSKLVCPTHVNSVPDSCCSQSSADLMVPNSSIYSSWWNTWEPIFEVHQRQMAIAEKSLSQRWIMEEMLHTDLLHLSFLCEATVLTLQGLSMHSSLSKSSVLHSCSRLEISEIHLESLPHGFQPPCVAMCASSFIVFFFLDTREKYFCFYRSPSFHVTVNPTHLTFSAASDWRQSSPENLLPFPSI